MNEKGTQEKVKTEKKNRKNLKMNRFRVGCPREKNFMVYLRDVS